MWRQAPQPDSNGVVRALPLAVAPIISGLLAATKPAPWTTRWVKIDDPRRYKGYKQDNPLRYCANRLLQVMESDPRMRDLIGA
jgi:hypothetical protein